MNSKFLLLLLIGSLFMACQSKPSERTPSSTTTHQCVPAQGNFARNDQLHVSSIQQISNTHRTSRTIHISRTENGCRFFRLEMPATSISTLTPEDVLTIAGTAAIGDEYTVVLQSPSQQIYRISCTLPKRNRAEMRAIALDSLRELGLEYKPDVCMEFQVIPASEQAPEAPGAPTPVEI